MSKALARLEAEAERLGLPLVIRQKQIIDAPAHHSNGSVTRRELALFIISMQDPDDEDRTLEVELTARQVLTLVAGMQLARLGRTKNLPWTWRND